MIRTYSELIKFGTFEDRFEYLKLNGNVGSETFGFDRYFNQVFYRSLEWQKLRNEIIIRDNGCDLGVLGHEIFGKIVIHHLNPITLYDIEENSDILMNPEYLICTCHQTHNAIHYGNKDLLVQDPIARSKNDTCPWRKE